MIDTVSSAGDDVEALLGRLDTIDGRWARLGLIRQAASAIDRLRRERDEARGIVRDIHWMAVRYADGRKSYATGMCNDAIRKGYDAGWLTYRDEHDIDPQYAREGYKPEYRSIATALAAAERRAEEAEQRLQEMEDSTAWYDLVTRAEAAESRAAAAESALTDAEAEVARLREALRRVADLDIVEASIDPGWFRRHARAALQSGGKK